MLSIQVSKNASIQLETAAIYYSMFPIRVQAAQREALESSKRKLKDAFKTVGAAAKYLEYDLIPYGVTGMRLKIKPPEKAETGEYGRNTQIGASILLTGRKGKAKIHARSGGVMATRPGWSGGSRIFFYEARLVAIKSKKQQLREIAKAVILKQISAALTKQGFGVRGGVRGL
jgi:hypothetical protein